MEIVRVQTITIDKRSILKKDGENKVFLEMTPETWDFIFERVRADLKRKAYRRKYYEKSVGGTRREKVVDPKEVNIPVSIQEEEL